MQQTTTLSDIVGIEHCKVGFFQELQNKIELLNQSNVKLENKRKEMEAILNYLRRVVWGCFFGIENLWGGAKKSL